MQTKLLEIRDSMTFIPALAVQVSGTDGYLARRAGFDRPFVYLVKMEDEQCAYDPFTWDTRTMNVAHLYIEGHWDTLKDHDVVDVQFILGETQQPKISESVDV